MSDDKNTLFTEIEESTEETESNTDSKDTTNPSSGNDQEEVVELLGDKKEVNTSSGDSTASERAEKQKEGWARKIASGEKTLDDLESNPALKWLVPDVKKKLGYDDSLNDFDTKIASHETSRKFKQDTDFLNTLSVTQANEIRRKANEYITELGVDNKKALSKAIKDLTPKIEEDAKTRKERVEKGQIPSGQSSSGVPQFTEEQLGELSQKEFNRVMDDVESGKAEIIS